MLMVSQIGKGVPEMDQNGFVFGSNNFILLKSQKLITVLAGSLVRVLTI